MLWSSVPEATSQTGAEDARFMVVCADADVPGLIDELGPADKRRVADAHDPAGAEALVPQVLAGGDLEAREILGARRIGGSGRGGRGAPVDAGEGGRATGDRP